MLLPPCGYWLWTLEGLPVLGLTLDITASLKLSLWLLRHQATFNDTLLISSAHETLQHQCYPRFGPGCFSSQSRGSLWMVSHTALTLMIIYVLMTPKPLCLPWIPPLFQSFPTSPFHYPTET